MNYKLLLLFFLVLSWSARAQTLLRQEGFETDGEGSRYTSTTFDRRNESPVPYIGQYFLRENNPVQSATGTQTFGTAASPTVIGNVTGTVPTVPATPVPGSYPAGTFFWASEGAAGQTQNPAVPRRPGQTVTLKPVSIAGYTALKVQVAFADARGPGAPLAMPQWENDDFIRVQVRIDGTGSWITIGQFVGDNPGGAAAGNLRQDTNLDRVSSAAEGGTVLTSTLTDFTFNYTGSGTTLEARVEVDQFSATEELAFDNIRVIGTASATAAPVLAGIESTSLTYNEGDPATFTTNSLTVSDSDSPNLTGATVSISTGFVPAQDRLVFVNQNGISSAYNTGSGILSLSGSASLAAYQAALRSVKYQNIELVNATGGTRLVTFVVSDGTNTSNAPSRSINFIAQLNSPAALPYTEEFETNGEGTRYSSNSWNTTAPCFGFLRVNTNPYACSPTTFGNVSGTGYWYSEATSTLNNPYPIDIGTFVLAPVNATNTGNLHFNVRLGVGTGDAPPVVLQWEIDDYVKFFYRVNGGSWVQFGAFFGDGPANNNSGNIRRDADLNGVADPTGTLLTTTLQNIDFALPASVTGAAVDFMIEVNSDGQEELAFDQIVVTGTPFPTVTTAAASNVAPASATLGGNVTADGGVPITERGVVYVVGTGTPTTANTKALVATSGIVVGTAFSGTVSGLTPATTYSVRAYATNSAGTSYGSVVSFTTPAALNVSGVITNVACNGGSNGAINLTPNGGTAPYSFNWGGGVTTEDRTGLAAGTYTVTITDATSTSITRSFTVTQPSGVAVTLASQTNIACFGGTTGAASINLPTGGVGGYTYDWTPGTPTGDGTRGVSGLSAGTYTVTVTDANGCTASRSFTISQPATALGGTTVVTNVACFGGSNGAINLTPNGGTAPYSFNWGGITTEDRTGLTAGTYTVTITDANSCTASRSATITQPSAPVSGMGVLTNVACFGGSNGAINLTPAGGTPGGYRFNWGGVTTEDRTDLTAGAYSVTITDVNGCTGTASFTISQPPAISLASGSQTNVTTAGGSDGTASVTPAGGTPGYTYDWSPGTPPGDGTASVSGLSAGTYTVTVTDANGCTASQTYTITQPVAVTAAPVVVSPANGSLLSTDIPTYAGTAPAGSTVTVFVDGSSIGITTATGGNWSLVQPTSLTQGNHTVYATAQVTGSAASANSNTNTFTVDSVSPTVAISSATAPNNGTSSSASFAYTVTFSESVTGFVTGDLTVSNGTISGFSGTGASYTFNVTPTANGAVVVNIPANVAQDAAGNGNTAASSLYTITYSATPTIAGFAADPASVCVGSPLTFTATVGNLSGSYAYTLSNGSTVRMGTLASSAFSETLTSSETGGQSFSLLVSSSGQRATAITSVTVNSLPVAGLISNGPLTCARTSVTLTASGGSSYRFSAGAAQSGSSNLALVNASGIYSVTVTNASGCVSTTSVPVSEDKNAPAMLTLTASPSTTLTCAQTSLTLTAAATGTGLSYAFSGPGPDVSLPGSGNSRTVGVAGTYSVTVTGANGCTTSQSTVIYSNTTAPVATLTASSTAVCLPNSITLTAGGGVSYTFSPGASQIGTTNQAVVTQSGAYTVAVTTANGCTTTTSLPVTVNPVPEAPSLTGVSRRVVQSNTPRSLLDFVTADTGNTLSFSGLSGLLNPPTVDISQTGERTFQVTQTTASGCTGPATPFSLTILPSIPATQTVCRSSPVVLSSSTPGNRYEWYKNGTSAPFKLTEIASIQRGTGTASLTLVSPQTTASYYLKIFAADGSFVFEGPFKVAVDYGCVAPGARQAAPELAEAPLSIVLLPNPIADGQVRAVVRGAGGQFLRVSLLNRQGQPVGEQHWSIAESEHIVDLSLGGQPSGLYLLQAQTPGQHRVVKVIKP